MSKPRPITIKPLCDRCKSAAATKESGCTDNSILCAECVSESDHAKDLEVWVCTHTRKCGWQGVCRDMKSLPHPKLTNVKVSHCPLCLNTSFYVRLLDGTPSWKPSEKEAA